MVRNGQFHLRVRRDVLKHVYEILQFTMKIDV